MPNRAAEVGLGTMIHYEQLSNIGVCKIGKGCNIHSHVWIGDDVVIGNRCRIQAFSFIPKGVTLEDDVFIGPHVCFTNDKYPPSGGTHWAPILVKHHAVIGANATILPGVTIGVSAIVAAGATVTEDVPDHAIVMNTAVVQGPPIEGGGTLPPGVTVRYEYYTGSVVARRKGTRK